MPDNINTIEGTEVFNVNDPVQGSHAITLEDVKNFVGEDKFHSNIVATAPYDPLNPLTGWVAPSSPITGNTVEVKFTDGTVANYTFDGTVWVLDFIDKTLAQHDLRLLASGTIERGSDSATDAKGAQFLHNSYSHLNGFSDNWVGTAFGNLSSFRIGEDNTLYTNSTSPNGILDSRYNWKIKALTDDVNFNFSQSTTPYISDNNVFMMGWNLSPGGGSETVGKSALGLSFENNYEPIAGTDIAEYHTFFVTKAGVQKRLESYTINKDLPETWERFNTLAQDYHRHPVTDHVYSRLAANNTSGDIILTYTDPRTATPTGVQHTVSPSQYLYSITPINFFTAANAIWQNQIDFTIFGQFNTAAFNLIKYNSVVVFNFKSPLQTYANDAAAAIGGVAQHGLYATPTGEVRIKL